MFVFHCFSVSLPREYQLLLELASLKEDCERDEMCDVNAASWIHLQILHLNYY